MATIKPNIQINDLVREMTNKEYESYQAQQAENVARQAEQDAKAGARLSALDKLSALGLTEDELGALIGTTATIHGS